jgi:hypothetical protein
MKDTVRKVEAIVVILIAVACGALGILWPDWQRDLRAQGYYDCSSPDLIGTKDLLPEQFDWRSNASLPPVKNQGNCGSCWAFSAVGATECTYAAKLGISNLDLSEQNLVSACGANAGSCYGGFPTKALDYIRSVGIVDELCFPYQSGACFDSCASECNCFGGCSYPCLCSLCSNSASRLTRISGYGHVQATVDDVKRALICRGPLSVTSMNWSHAVVLVGYDDTVGAWVIRNSWDDWWGDGGYGYIFYNLDPHSDIINNAYYILP